MENFSFSLVSSLDSVSRMSEFLNDFSILLVYIVRDWWWIVAPPVLFRFVKKIYIFYKTERYFKKIPWVMLEVLLPQVVEKTPKAMEGVLNGFHSLWDKPTWRAKWFEGRMLLWSMTLELVSIDGVVHFYIYVPRPFRNVVESSIYSEYPQAEISEVEDYTKALPEDIPNKTWNLWGTDLVLTEHYTLPLRSYEFYESIVEEKRLDPLSAMLEFMSSLKEGEQLWFQILLRPIMGGEMGSPKWQEEIRRESDKMMGKEEKKGQKKKAIFGVLGEFIGEMGGTLFGSTPVPVEKPQRLDPLLWKLSPGEQDKLKAMELKGTKLGFQANARFIYLGKNEVFSKAKGVAGMFGALKQFAGYNSIAKPDKVTKTKVTFFMVNRRTYFRKKRILRFYAKRLFPRHHKPYILNVEEVATMYHFPGRMITPAPFVPRIYSKKGEPPATLPTG